MKILLKSRTIPKQKIPEQAVGSVSSRTQQTMETSDENNEVAMGYAKAKGNFYNG